MNTEKSNTPEEEVKAIVVTISQAAAEYVKDAESKEEQAKKDEAINFVLNSFNLSDHSKAMLFGSIGMLKLFKYILYLAKRDDIKIDDHDKINKEVSKYFAILVEYISTTMATEHMLSKASVKPKIVIN
jgi:ribose 5-phosphate isomerase